MGEWISLKYKDGHLIINLINVILAVFVYLKLEIERCCTSGPVRNKMNKGNTKQIQKILYRMTLIELIIKIS